MAVSIIRPSQPSKTLSENEFSANFWAGADHPMSSGNCYHSRTSDHLKWHDGTEYAESPGVNVYLDDSDDDTRECVMA